MNIRAYNKKDIENIIQLVSDGLEEFDFEFSEETSESDLVNIEREYFDNNGTFLIMESEKKQRRFL